ncbi:putative bifunctional diguanylate cyclase/phosphodiesterase [Ideonella sp.]|uniref:putative bifunctional diguanylate cyclase/phosphodiesterase n=1 Tax=Ideonella sp. TaxID=1929293 RepID=UPI003BB7E996
MSDPLSVFGALGDLPEDPQALMQRRLARERDARKHAEQLLNDKSRDLYEALQTAQNTQRRLQMALWASGEGIWDWSAEDGVFRVEGLLAGGEPLEPQNYPNAELLALILEDDREPTLLAWHMHMMGSQDDIDSAFRVHIAGQVRWVRIRGRTLSHDHRNRPLHVAGTVKDITLQRAAEESLHMMAQAFASTHDALAVIDLGGRIIETNQALLTLIGRKQPELLGQRLADWLRMPSGSESRSARFESVLTCRQGEVPVDVSVTPVGGRSRCRIVSLRDISERRQAEARLERMALQDTLTELPNRQALEQHLQRCVAGWRDEGFGLLFLDLDGFKSVNDSFGHRAGDQLLREVSQRLQKALPQAFIGRWGGDEFIAVLPRGSADAEIRESAQLLIATLAMPFLIGNDQEMLVGPSIGAVIYPQDAEDSAGLLRKADVAMYAAKDRGKNCLCLFEPSIEAAAVRRLRLQALLRIDAERNAFTFVVQPKVDRHERQVGGELLMRWHTAEFGSVSPVEFIPLAEHTGAIELMGRHALYAAAKLVSQLPVSAGHISVAVNLSPRQLQNGGLERMALRACERFGVSPSQIELELTESALASGIDVVQPLLQRLRQRGFSLALDDFGTGYSSLSHLLHLPFHKVKIDRAFVKDLQSDARAREVVKGALQICRGLGMCSVAEGVETREQFELLCDLGVDEFQGYLFARPMPLEEWLQQARPETSV